MLTTPRGPDEAPEADEPGLFDLASYSIEPRMETFLTRSGDLSMDFVDQIEGWIHWYDRDGIRERAGRFRVLVFRVEQSVLSGCRAYLLMNGHSPMASYLHSVLFDKRTGEIREPIADRYRLTSGRIVVLDSIELLPQHRSRGVGLGVAARLIDLIAPESGTLVALIPGPQQCRAGYGESRHRDQEAERALTAAMQYDDLPPDSPAIRRQLVRHWARLGFTRIGRSGVMGLSTSDGRPSIRLLGEEAV